MSLNTSKGNMYGFVTHTWNTIKGKCVHDCDYCYMKRWRLNDVRFDEKELKTNLGEDNTIFVGSSNDIFSDAIEPEWIYKTINHCFKYPKNTYLFQTKSAMWLEYFNYPENTILGTTIESDRNWLGTKIPSVKSRAIGLRVAKKKCSKTMLTIEPIMDFNLRKFIVLIETAASPVRSGEFYEPADRYVARHARYAGGRDRGGQAKLFAGGRRCQRALEILATQEPCCRPDH